MNYNRRDTNNSTDAMLSANDSCNNGGKGNSSIATYLIPESSMHRNQPNQPLSPTQPIFSTVATTSPSKLQNSSINIIDAFERHKERQQHYKEQKQDLDDGDSISQTSGCLRCKKDDDHANLLLCEVCNDEYHTYCLDPPLSCVPEGDFFCDKCKPLHSHSSKDGLDALVAALPPTYTSRFGEIVWAAGGVGFGWWPACIYDPRLTVGGARKLAMKNLGKKHLVYFFECHDAPFTVLVDAKLMKWDEGILEEYDLGKTARAMGKSRITLFEHALQAAIAENDKPVAYRLDWNHQEDPFDSKTSPARKPVVSNDIGNKRTAHQQSYSNSSKKKAKKSNVGGYAKDKEKSQQHGLLRRSGRSSRMTSSFIAEEESRDIATALELSRNVTTENKMTAIDTNKPAVINRSNLNAIIESLASSSTANEIEQMEDGKLFCKVLFRSVDIKMIDGQPETTIDERSSITNIGFITLLSRRKSTFADARRTLLSDLDDDCIPPGTKWKFYVPRLGPMSLKQESKMGPMLDFLQAVTTDKRLGDGSCQNPLKLVLDECITSKRK